MNFTNLTNFINSLPAYGIPTADVIVYRDHRELYRHRAGEPLRGDELYYMYSCTKVVTCIAALQLFEQGKFLMRDPVSNVLPEFADVRVKNGAYTVPAERPITFRHLFTMTAGLNYNLTSAYIQDISDRTGGRCPTRETIAAIAKIPLDFHPGDRFQYSLCHDVLAAAVEVLSGMRFGEYVKKNIFEPCGMVDSTFIMTDSVKARMAPQYRFNDKRGVAEQTPMSNMYILGSEYESGGAGLTSTTEDYALFLDMVACGGVGKTGNRILKEETVKLWGTNHVCGAAADDFDEMRRGYGYGLGVRTMVDKAKAGFLGKYSEFGWGGAAGATILVDPDEHIAMFYAHHMLNPFEEYYQVRLRNVLYTSLAR